MDFDKYEIDARISKLVTQRDAAMNETVLLTGMLAVANKKIAELTDAQQKADE